MNKTHYFLLGIFAVLSLTGLLHHEIWQDDDINEVKTDFPHLDIQWLGDFEPGIVRNENYYVYKITYLADEL